MSERPRLGKGLSALIGEYLDPKADAAEVRTLALASIVPNPLQPRTVFTEAELKDLAASIQANGLLQPLVVRPAPGRSDRWELIAGERRFRAVTSLGWVEVPVLVRDASDETLLVLALVENLQREALSALEEAEGYQALTDQFSMTHAEIADAVGKDRSTVANLVRLLNLPSSVRRLLQERAITPGHARALLSVEDPGKAGALARQAASEGWSVRETERRAGALRPKKKKRPAAPDPVVQSLEGTLRDHFATRVSIRRQRGGGGSVEISFHDDTDFERVFELLTGSSVADFVR